jgi:hypothetical protein
VLSDSGGERSSLSSGILYILGVGGVKSNVKIG